jgi:uncharacterized protein (DUF2252 family)
MTDLVTPSSWPHLAGSRHTTRTDSEDAGRRARRRLPVAKQAVLDLPEGRPDPVDIAREVASRRVPELVPLRHARMAESPFAFYRGNALGMAADLAESAVSGLGVQLCGDAHLSNFGLFASPERRLVFDLNDFDETFPGPWEWDVKRLAASIVVAGRSLDFSAKERRRCVRKTLRRYRDGLAELASRNPLEVWYSQADASALTAIVGGQVSVGEQRRLDRAIHKARRSDRMKALAKLTELTPAGVRIKADPPEIVPLDQLLPDAERTDLVQRLHHLLEDYARSLPHAQRFLLSRYEPVDAARKVVGVGSVGTRCWVVLLRGVDDGDPLFLQVKEAGRSVLADHVPEDMLPAVPPVHEGERVIHGQRLMQASGDIFLGWQSVEGIDGRRRDFYVRQLKDMKGSAAVETMEPSTLAAYGAACGWVLARAHARSGDPIAISTYVGVGDDLPDALAEFAEAYADVNELDHARFSAAVADGRLTSASVRWAQPGRRNGVRAARSAGAPG